MKMSLRIVLLFILAVCLATFPIVSSAQTPQAAPRITAAIDARNLTMLHGNVHPLSRAESGQGGGAATTDQRSAGQSFGAIPRVADTGAVWNAVRAVGRGFASGHAVAGGTRFRKYGSQRGKNND